MSHPKRNEIMESGGKKCFIIMPLTTPEDLREQYRDGASHFKHVLDCLFIPAVKNAGYNPVPPVAQGSDLIHAEIIQNLESSELVLCDMSSLNPNVFFEFGIRTSLNKPVCVVKDELTKKVPFDTGILNYLEYQSALESWDIDHEVTRLAEHIEASFTRSKGLNSLWRYFGLKEKAKPYQGETGTDAKLDLLSLQLDSVRQKLENLEEAKILSSPDGSSTQTGKLARFILPIFETVESSRIFMRENNSVAELAYRGFITNGERQKATEFAWKNFGVKLKFRKFRTLDPESTISEEEHSPPDDAPGADPYGP